MELAMTSAGSCQSPTGRLNSLDQLPDLHLRCIPTKEWGRGDTHLKLRTLDFQFVVVSHWFMVQIWSDSVRSDR
jgi:hypothetical protein